MRLWHRGRSLLSTIDLFYIFTARRCESAVYNVVMCLSVCPSQVGVVFYVTFRVAATGEDRNFKFGKDVDHNTS